MSAILVLWKREVIRFYRQPSRIVGAIGSPLLFWLFLGSGIGSSFRSSAQPAIDQYDTYFFPGVLLMILLFAAIFSTISLIEDRREGFLQAVLVSPVSRLSIVLGKVLGGMSVAFLQSLLFLCLAPLADISLNTVQLGWVLLILLVNGFSLTCLGFFIAWQFKSIQGFHAVMNLVLLPLWILSGAIFPMEGASVWIQWLMKLNPLTYGMNALHSVIFNQSVTNIFGSIGIVGAFGLILLGASVMMASKRNIKNLA